MVTGIGRLESEPPVSIPAPAVYTLHRGDRTRHVRDPDADRHQRITGTKAGGVRHGAARSERVDPRLDAVRLRRRE